MKFILVVGQKNKSFRLYLLLNQNNLNFSISLTVQDPRKIHPMFIQENIVQARLTEHYRNQQNRLKQVKEKLVSQCQRLDDKIGRQIEKIKQTSSQISRGVQAQTKIYNESLNSQNYSSQVVDLTTLSGYLKKQKAYLSELISSQDVTQNTPKSGKDLLHKLSNRKKIQKYLQHLQCVKLQKEIQYLQNYVIIGKKKSGSPHIVYEDIQSVTIKQENQQVEKIKLSLEELQRIVSLSNQCGGNQNHQLSTKTFQLNKQNQRLYTIEQILDIQTKEIVQVKHFFQNYDPQQIISFLKDKIAQIQSFQNIKTPSETNISQLLIDKQEIQFLLNFELQTETLKIFKKPFDEADNLIKSCKAKLKKIKS